MLNAKSCCLGWGGGGVWCVFLERTVFCGRLFLMVFFLYAILRPSGNKQVEECRVNNVPWWSHNSLVSSHLTHTHKVWGVNHSGLLCQRVTEARDGQEARCERV